MGQVGASRILDAEVAGRGVMDLQGWRRFSTGRQAVFGRRIAGVLGGGLGSEVSGFCGLVATGFGVGLLSIVRVRVLKRGGSSEDHSL